MIHKSARSDAKVNTGVLLRPCGKLEELHFNFTRSHAYIYQMPLHLK